MAETDREVTTAAAVKHSQCRLCCRTLPTTSGRLHGKKWTCTHCNSLESLLYRNLGGEASQGWEGDGKAAFFQRLAEDPQTGQYDWPSVRTLIIESQTISRTKSQCNKVTGESLPLSVWKARGYAEEAVVQFPSETCDKLGVLYCLPVKATVMKDVRARVTAEVLQRERAAKERKDGKRTACAADLDVVPTGASGNHHHEPAKRVKTEKSNAKTTKAAEKQQVKDNKKLEKNNQALGAVASKASAALTRTVAALRSFLPVAEKTGLSEDDLVSLREAVKKGDDWKKEAVETLSRVTQCQGLPVPLPALSYSLKDMTDYCKTVGSLLKDARAQVKTIKAAAAAERKKEEETKEKAT